MNPLEELAGRNALLCPDTGAPAALRDGRVVAPGTGRDFGPVEGPLDLLKGSTPAIDASRVSARDVERVRTHLTLPALPEVDAQIAAAIAATGARFRDAHLSAEARILAERFGMPGFDFSQVEPARAASPMERVAAAIGRVFTSTPKAASRLEHLSNSVGEHLTAGLAVYRSVRVRNAGTTTLRASVAPVASVETRWAAHDGRIVPECTQANALPVDLEPGRELTLVLRLRAPSDPGRFELRAHLVVAGEPQGPPFLAAPVEIVRCELPVLEYEYHPALLDYERDHAVAAQELAAFLDARYPGRKATLLEIGGGVHPTGHALAAGGHRVVSTDISHAQSILGTLFFRHTRPELRETLAFVSSEGSELPFAGGAFDGAMLYAAFHHFAEPLALLAEMKRVTQPGGFLYLACENCAPDPADATYREELVRGINEQMWTLAEYTGFFRKASLRVARARVDHHSLKVFLVKE